MLVSTMYVIHIDNFRPFSQ